MKSENRIFLSFLLNLIFTIIEIIGGIITNSIALISDAVHDLGDSLSLGFALVLERKSKKKPDHKFTYGYRRYSLLGALISGVILLLGTAYVIYETVGRIISPEPVNSEILIYFAILGVVVNGLAAYNISKGKSLNERVITLHLFEDVFGWVALLIGSIVMHFTGFILLDSILSIVFSLIILSHAYKSIKKVFDILLERVPVGLNIEDIKNKLEKVSGVIEIHHFHLWSLEGQTHLLTMHVVVKEETSSVSMTQIRNNLNDVLKEFNIRHSTIQMEFQNKTCSNENCEVKESPKKRHQHHHH